MVPSAIVALLASIGNILLGLLTLSRNSRSSTNRLFAVLASASAGWSIANFVSLQVSDPNLALFLTRLVMFFVVLQTSSFFLLMFSFPHQQIQMRPLRKRLYVGFTAITLAVTLSPFLFIGLDPSQPLPPPVPLPGPGMLFFLPHALISVLGGLIRLVRQFRRTSSLEKAQWRFILYGALALFTLVPLSNFVAVIVFKFSGLIFLSPLYTLLFVSSISYAIARHRLLDIRAVVAKSVTYTLLLFVLAGIYSGAIYAVSSFLFKDSITFVQQSALNAVLAMVLAFTFQPLRRFFEKLTDRIFYRDKYDSQEVLNRISKILAAEIVLERLLDKTLSELCAALNIEMAQFMIFENKRIYKVAHYGPLPGKMMIVPEMQKLRQSMLVSDELEGGERKTILDDHGVRVSVMLRTKEEFVGFLFLGDKLSGDIYSDQDLKLLEILASELAVAIVNAKAYEEIQQFANTLQLKVNEATKNLRKANHNLKALDKAKDEFISMASHQLRTPLTTIKGYLSMMIEGDAGKVTHDQKEYLDYAFGGAERMVSLISDLLNVSRLSAGRFLIEKQPTDLVEVVADEVRQLQSHADAKHLELIFDHPKKKIPNINIDEGKTRQVIMNFIDNAIYYTRQGSVTVTLEADNHAIRVKVKDTGIGVPEAARQKLFSKFFRAENAQVARPDGTGLGLYLAKRVVEDQGGTIIFDSQEGKGSTFGFEMPFKTKVKK